MVRSVIVVMGKANFTWVLVAIVTMTVTTPRDGILFGLSFFTNSILLLLFIFGIVIEGGMAFEVGMAVVVVMAWADARSVTVLVIVESIFLGSCIIIEGRMAVVVMGWSEVVMRTAWISRIVFAIITMMFIEGSCSRLFGLSIISTLLCSIIVEVAWIVSAIVSGVVAVVTSVDGILFGLIFSS